MSVRDSVRPPQPAQPLPARNFLNSRFVYAVISQRARGLSIGINMNPDKRCNFGCVYCEVDRSVRGGASRVRVPEMLAELERLLGLVRSGRLAELGYPADAVDELPFREVALSGDGEPTLCRNFFEITAAVVQLRARRMYPHFKIVLITNTTGLGLPAVRAGLALLGPTDEVWAKLDAGTQAYMDKVNRPEVSLERVLENIRELGCQRPVVIQSLFPMVHGEEPPESEILAYAHRLRDLRVAGVQIPLVQVYSAHRPAMDETCSHLPLRSLSQIAKTIREESGLNAEVF